MGVIGGAAPPDLTKQSWTFYRTFNRRAGQNDWLHLGDLSGGGFGTFME